VEGLPGEPRSLWEHDVRLDQVIGVKRQSLYYDAAGLVLDARVPSKKFRGKTYRELLSTEAAEIMQAISFLKQVSGFVSRVSRDQQPGTPDPRLEDFFNGPLKRRSNLLSPELTSDCLFCLYLCLGLSYHSTSLTVRGLRRSRKRCIACSSLSPGCAPRPRARARAASLPEGSIMP
jgi:hypothetical protein